MTAYFVVLIFPFLLFPHEVNLVGGWVIQPKLTMSKAEYLLS